MALSPGCCYVARIAKSKRGVFVSFDIISSHSATLGVLGVDEICHFPFSSATASYRKALVNL